jgi:hypothetical protein
MGAKALKNRRTKECQYSEKPQENTHDFHKVEPFILGEEMGQKNGEQWHERIDNRGQSRVYLYLSPGYEGVWQGTVEKAHQQE